MSGRAGDACAGGLLAVGVGASRGCPASELEDLVAATLGAAGLDAGRVRRLATAEVKRDEAAVLALGAARGWELAFFSADALAAVDVPTPSAVVARHVGTPSVAEASALLAAGGGSVLLVAKRRSPHATCAVATA